jgi:hypothetical protein
MSWTSLRPSVKSCKVCANLVRGVTIMFTSTVRVGTRSSDLTERLSTSYQYLLTMATTCLSIVRSNTQNCKDCIHFSYSHPAGQQGRSYLPAGSWRW